MEEEKKDPLYLAKIWRGNELLDNKWPVKVPNISLAYEQSELQQVLKNVDENDEDDIDKVHPYEIHSMLVVERLPVIKRIEEYEEEYRKVLREVKMEQKMPELLKQLYVENVKKGNIQKERMAKTQPRITKDDQNNEYHSLNRCLDRRLYLLVQVRSDSKTGNDNDNDNNNNNDKDKDKSKGNWEFPSDIREPGETLTETAQRALFEAVGPYLRYSIISQAPFGHSQIDFEKKQANKKGAQMFFHKAYYLSGNGKPDVSDMVTDLGWFTKQQVATMVSPKIWDSIHDLLLD
ncbi:mitochondrial ribosomal protein L46 [Reticulomyxa filosa]|uniref:Mitochondrial ribosomal protein L46 n=1 Tax=Reticulomyxa filosa TaxID=46433 RepID=X6MDT2_RETFI|nr:mitochondrial ribosomal protein L46 [Reticulomyxa filosa]|eukprot:ETO11200.1 mitochondrial ribosomal protein L46 [Reticulomyxa filosa]